MIGAIGHGDQYVIDTERVQEEEMIILVVVLAVGESSRCFGAENGKLQLCGLSLIYCVLNECDVDLGYQRSKKKEVAT